MPMNVVICLPHSLAARVGIACPASSILHVAPSWVVALRLARDRDADALVFEPTELTTADDIAALLVDAPHIVLVAYTSVSSAALRATFALGRYEAAHVIIRGVDDEPARLRTTITRAVESSLAGRVLALVAGPVARVPAPLADALGTLLRHPRRFLGVEDLAQSAALHRRALDRWLRRAGLASARTLLACARTAGAWRQLAHVNATLAAAAESMGVSERLLAHEIRRATGAGVRRLARRTAPGELADRLANAMWPARDDNGVSPRIVGHRTVGARAVPLERWQARFFEVREPDPDDDEFRPT